MQKQEILLKIPGFAHEVSSATLLKITLQLNGKTKKSYNKSKVDKF